MVCYVNYQNQTPPSYEGAIIPGLRERTGSYDCLPPLLGIFFTPSIKRPSLDRGILVFPVPVGVATSS